MKTFVCTLLIAICAVTIGCRNRGPAPADDPTYHHAMRPISTEAFERDSIFTVVQEPYLDVETGFWKMVVVRESNQFEFAVLLPQKKLFPRGAHVLLNEHRMWMTDMGDSFFFTAE